MFPLIFIAAVLLTYVVFNASSVKRPTKEAIESEFLFTALRLEQAIESCKEYLLPFYEKCVNDFHNDNKGRISNELLAATIGGLQASLQNRYRELTELHIA